MTSVFTWEGSELKLDWWWHIWLVLSSSLAHRTWPTALPASSEVSPTSYTSLHSDPVYLQSLSAVQYVPPVLPSVSVAGCQFEGNLLFVLSVLGDHVSTKKCVQFKQTLQRKPCSGQIKLIKLSRGVAPFHGTLCVVYLGHNSFYFSQFFLLLSILCL